MTFAVVVHKMFGVGLGVGQVGSNRYGLSLHVPFMTFQLLFVKE